MWDEVELTVPSDVESVSFTVSAGHRRWDVTLPSGEARSSRQRSFARRINHDV
jgi:hypothetical protein